MLYPYCLRPIYKDYLWGGDAISRYCGRDLPPGVYAESWEVADHADGMSVVENGVLQGKTLHELVFEMGEELLGQGHTCPAFPLLLKIIDARERLSVQVHPDGSGARAYGGEPKTESWYVLDAEPDAHVYAGFKASCTPDEFKRAVQAQQVDGLLNHIPVKKGDVVYIPGGRVHAIDAGCLMLEIQQSSNTTFRIYDWGRVDKHGQSRPLHIDQAVKVIRWDDRESACRTPVLTSEARGAGNMSSDIISSPFFTVGLFELHSAELFSTECKTFHIWFVEDGVVDVRYQGGTVRVEKGHTCLIPACMKEYELQPVDGMARVIRVQQP